MPKPKQIVQAAGGYLKSHPEELLRAVRNAVLLRVGLPLDAMRWFAGQIEGRKAPRDVVIEAVPPGIRFAATIEQMGTKLRASAVVYIERVAVSGSEARIEVRLADVSLTLVEDADSPVATLIKSGALDLSKPGNLAAYMPKRPPVLVEAADDRIVLDLMKHPKLAKNAKAQRIAGLIGAIVGIRAIETDDDHLEVGFQPLPRGAGDAMEALRDYL